MKCGAPPMRVALERAGRMPSEHDPTSAVQLPNQSANNSALLSQILTNTPSTGRNTALSDPGVTASIGSIFYALNYIKSKNFVRSVLATMSNPSQIEEPEQQARREDEMADDKDVRRLEDRIAASEVQAQLRLDLVTQRIEANLTRIADQVTAMRGDLQEQREDNRALREDINKRSGTVLVTVISTGIALAALFVALFFGFGTIWGNGVQVGQALQHVGAATGAAKP